MYESDVTRFLRELKQKNPAIQDEQRKGRALWWDKSQDLDTTERNVASNVPQQPYVYQTRR